MPIPNLYSVLPLKLDESTDIDSLTDLSSGLIQGSDGEKYAVLSYFPKTLKLSKLTNFVVNKYVLFVLNEDLGKEYEVEWMIDITQAGESVMNQFVGETLQVSTIFEFAIAVQHNYLPDNLDWEFTLTTTCEIYKNGTLDKSISINQTLLPIEPDLLSSNGASFEDESGLDNSSIFLGNEPTTHFVRGHLGEYLVNKKKQENGGVDTAVNNASAFVNQTAAIAYNNTLSAIESFGCVGEITKPDSGEMTFSEMNMNFDNPFHQIFSNFTIEQAIINDSPFNENAFQKIGICDLNLHHVLPLVLEEVNARIETLAELLEPIKNTYNLNRDPFIVAYHKCVFPKSAIGLSVDIFDQLFTAFKFEASSDNRIYETFERTLADENSKITDWKELGYSELREQSNDPFMKNLIAEYYLGFYNEYTSGMIDVVKPKNILKIDWSQFIQKILNPSAIAIPFTLIKIQVNDLRSGKPIKNTLISRLEFYSFDLELEESMVSVFTKEMKYTYKVTKPYESGIPFGFSDSKVKRVKKICRSMGYYNGGITETYDNATRAAIYAYLTDADREFPLPPYLPESAAAAHIDPKKDTWIDYIIEDFESNCMTDGDGILNCRVPDQLLNDRKLNINLGFSEFAIIREIFKGEDKSTMSDKPLKRPDPEDGELKTGFRAEWDGDPTTIANPNEQNLSWEDNIAGKTFGWKIIDQEETTSDYLKVAIPLEVKKSTTEDYNYLKTPFTPASLIEYSIEDYAHFSTFYDVTGIHFVLYGMQWCQPIWNPLPADVTHWIGGPILPTAHPRSDQPAELRVAIDDSERFLPGVCTMYDASDHRSGQGRDYGMLVFYNGEIGRSGNAVHDAAHFSPAVRATVHKLLDFGDDRYYAPRSNGHQGIDYHAFENTSPVFAPHSGVVGDRSPRRAGAFGRIVRFKAMNLDLRYTLAHLSELPIVVALDQKILAGQYIGKAGRTDGPPGDTYEDGPTHLHLETCSSSYFRRLSDPKKVVSEKDPEHSCQGNEEIYLNNWSKRIFPCDCHGGNGIGANTDPGNTCAIKVAGGSNYVANRCWASTNLHCPYMDPNNITDITPARTSALEVYRLQSQLTYLFEDDANQILVDPNNYLDPNNIDGAWGVSCENAIQRFRELHINNIIPNPADIPPIMDLWWSSQPANGDATWNELHIAAPYPRTNLIRVDK